MENTPVININKIESRFLRRFGDFGLQFSKLQFMETTEIPTAATDGKYIYYNPNFLGKLNIKQQTFIIGHEVLHVAFNHLKRRKDKNPKLWNIATDAVINAMLKDQGLEMVEGGVDMVEGLTMSAEQIYEKLLKEQEQKKQEQQQNQQKNNQEQGQENNQQQDEQNNEFDPHKMWDKVFDNDKNKSEEKNKQLSSKQDEKSEDVQNKQKTSQNKDEEEINEIEKYKEAIKKVQKKNEEKREERLEESVNPNKTEKENIIFNEKLGGQKQIIPWQSILRAATRGEQDYSYANATIEHGVLRQHLQFQPKPETEILLDTSGSISEQLLKNFLRECKNIFGQSKIKAGCFDTNFYGFKEIKSMKDIDNFQIEGRGGTDFNVAVDAFSRRVENHIIFTDGESDMPRNADRAIWVVFGNERCDGKKIKPKGALKVITISKEQYKKLSQNYISREEEEYER